MRNRVIQKTPTLQKFMGSLVFRFQIKKILLYKLETNRSIISSLQTALKPFWGFMYILCFYNFYNDFLIIIPIIARKLREIHSRPIMIFLQYFSVREASLECIFDRVNMSLENVFKEIVNSFKPYKLSVYHILCMTRISK